MKKLLSPPTERNHNFCITLSFELLNLLESDLGPSDLQLACCRLQSTEQWKVEQLLTQFSELHNAGVSIMFDYLAVL